MIDGKSTYLNVFAVNICYKYTSLRELMFQSRSLFLFQFLFVIDLLRIFRVILLLDIEKLP